VLHAVLTSATTATMGERAWLLAPAGDGATLEVRAVVGADTPLGERTAVAGTAAGYVFASGQPLAAAVRSPDQFPDDVSGASGGAAHVLCVPCEHGDQVLGILQVVDPTGGGSFTFDDVEVVTLLAAVAAAALADADTLRPAVPAPAALAGGLDRLAADDPARYSAIAPQVAALLDRG
jgi:GAF domain-containing protein